MSKRRKIVIAGIAVVALITIASLAIGAGRDSGTTVRTEQVNRRDLVEIVTASGFVQPKRKVDISADISGRVIQLPVVEGQIVEQGDLLLQIDPTTYQAMVRRSEAAVAQARAQAAQARANLIRAQSEKERAERLAQSDMQLISPADVEQAVTQAAVMEAQLDAAEFGVQQALAALSESQESLRKTTITAPMSGRVTRLNIEEGETAVVGTMNNPGSLLLTIADLSEMETRVRVDETDVPHLAYGDSAVVRIDAFPNRVFNGRVTSVAHSSIVNPETTINTGQGQAQAIDFEVVITLTDPPPELRPDLSATAEIITETRAQALAVPIISVTVRDAEGRRFEASESNDNGQAEEIEGVFVVENGVAEFRPVEVGIAGERYFEVVSGLVGGETVVAGPYQAIRELESGDAVSTPAAAQASAAADADAAAPAPAAETTDQGETDEGES